MRVFPEKAWEAELGEESAGNRSMKKCSILAIGEIHQNDTDLGEVEYVSLMYRKVDAFNRLERTNWVFLLLTISRVGQDPACD
jgi:hypothetical protein